MLRMLICVRWSNHADVRSHVLPIVSDRNVDQIICLSDEVVKRCLFLWLRLPRCSEAIPPKEQWKVNLALRNAIDEVSKLKLAKIEQKRHYIDKKMSAIDNGNEMTDKKDKDPSPAFSADALELEHKYQAHFGHGAIYKKSIVALDRDLREQHKHDHHGRIAEHKESLGKAVCYICKYKKCRRVIIYDFGWWGVAPPHNPHAWG